MIDVLKAITAAFKRFEKYGIEEDGTVTLKSMNAHNCRKTAMLSRLFILYKLLPMADDKAAVLGEMKRTFVTFASQYIELTSVVTDLISYVPIFTNELRASILGELAAVVDTKKEDPVRHARARITLAKFTYLF